LRGRGPREFRAGERRDPEPRRRLACGKKDGVIEVGYLITGKAELPRVLVEVA
jgi:hypothetical protein